MDWPNVLIKLDWHITIIASTGHWGLVHIENYIFYQKHMKYLFLTYSGVQANLCMTLLYSGFQAKLCRTFLALSWLWEAFKKKRRNIWKIPYLGGGSARGHFPYVITILLKCIKSHFRQFFFSPYEQKSFLDNEK